MVARLAEWITEILGTLGYPGLAFMMMLESMIAPVPSEVVMPFAGFLVVQEKFTFVGAVFASSLGTMIGSLIGYYMGRFGGYPVVHRFGRYLLLERHHLEATARWFEKRGEATVLICRFVPVVRHLISIPAGVGNMNLFRFCVFTFIGGTTWNVILLVAGMKLRERWEIIHHYSHEIDYVVVAGIVVVAGMWVYRQWTARRTTAD